MIARALAVGVRGGKWHALIDKVYGELNLFVSARKVIGKKVAAGVDRQSTEDFNESEVAEIRRLHENRNGDAAFHSPSTKTPCVPVASAMSLSTVANGRR